MVLHNIPAILSRKRTIAENTIELTFSVPDSAFSLQAGQYVSVCIPSLAETGIPDRCHDFSVASSPSNPKEISIAFRVSSSIFKTALLGLPLDGVVSIDGPKGALTLPDDTKKRLIFVAGGIGITPLLSMVRYATETSSSQQITLLYCNANEETVAYREELLALLKQNPHVALHVSIGVPDEKLFAPYIHEAPDALWYIVGAPVMVKKVQQILFESGILDAQIRIEEFSGYDKQ